MKNKLEDLNNILFEQLERLNDNEICADKESTQREIDKADAMTQIAEQVLGIHQIELDALHLVAKCGGMVKIDDVPNTILTKKELSSKLKSAKDKCSIPYNNVVGTVSNLLGY